MRKRLVRKAFEMISGIAMSENKDVCIQSQCFQTFQNFSEFLRTWFCGITSQFIP